VRNGRCKDAVHTQQLSCLGDEQVHVFACVVVVMQAGNSRTLLVCTLQYPTVVRRCS
jgi:hypothetical protein